jgi:hypothetical protein
MHRGLAVARHMHDPACVPLDPTDQEPESP